jgi:uncharacterized protein YodC (DUF2158 family)
MTVEGVDAKSGDVLCTWLADRVRQHSRFKALTLRMVEANPARLERSTLP